MRPEITNGLRARGVDALTTQEDGNAETPDPLVLDRAGELGRIMYTEDRDFMREGVRRQRAGIPFVSVIYAHALKVTIGKRIEDIHIMAECGSPEDVENTVWYLPI